MKKLYQYLKDTIEIYFLPEGGSVFGIEKHKNVLILTSNSHYLYRRCKKLNYINVRAYDPRGYCNINTTELLNKTWDVILVDNNNMKNIQNIKYKMVYNIEFGYSFDHAHH